MHAATTATGKKQSISVNETDQYLQARSILIMTSNKERDSEGP
jgi:hypothetical protein